jgi:hypothetical protein
MMNCVFFSYYPLARGYKGKYPKTSYFSLLKSADFFTEKKHMKSVFFPYSGAGFLDFSEF